MKAELSKIWNPPTTKGKVIAHSLRVLICVGVWNTPDMFSMGTFLLTIVQSIIMFCIMPSWCRSIVLLLVGFFVWFIGTCIGGDSSNEMPHDAIQGDVRPAPSEEHIEGFGLGSRQFRE